MHRVDRALMTKRSFLAGTAAFGAAGGTASAQGMAAHERDLYDAAKKEGEVTWYPARSRPNPERLSATPSAKPIRGSR